MHLGSIIIIEVNGQRAEGMASRKRTIYIRPFTFGNISNGGDIFVLYGH